MIDEQDFCADRMRALTRQSRIDAEAYRQIHTKIEDASHRGETFVELYNVRDIPEFVLDTLKTRGFDVQYYESPKRFLVRWLFDEGSEV